MIYFLHGNGFPSGCYQQFFNELTNYDTVFAEPVLTSPIDCPATLRWATMRDQAMTRTRTLLAQCKQANTQLVLVGHSMGGYLQLMAARRLIESKVANIDLIKDIVLIDSPFPLGYRQALLRFIQSTGLSNKFGPAPVAARRRYQWASALQAKEFFASKKFTQHWAPGVLDDFIHHALTKVDDSHLELTIPRETERDIYAYVSAVEARDALEYLRHEKFNPAFIAGKKSLEVSLGGRPGNYRLFADRFKEINTGHLIPMENPVACAQAVTQLLKLGSFQASR